jgi:hypothetical protein
VIEQIAFIHANGLHARMPWRICSSLSTGQPLILLVRQAIGDGGTPYDLVNNRAEEVVHGGTRSPMASRPSRPSFFFRVTRWTHLRKVIRSPDSLAWPPSRLESCKLNNRLWNGRWPAVSRNNRRRRFARTNNKGRSGDVNSQGYPGFAASSRNDS